MSEVQCLLLHLYHEWDFRRSLRVRRTDARGRYEELLSIHQPEVYQQYLAEKRSSEEGDDGEDDVEAVGEDVQWFFPQSEEEAVQALKALGKLEEETIEALEHNDEWVNYGQGRDEA